MSSDQETPGTTPPGSKWRGPGGATDDQPGPEGAYKPGKAAVDDESAEGHALRVKPVTADEVPGPEGGRSYGKDDGPDGVARGKGGVADDDAGPDGAIKGGR